MRFFKGVDFFPHGIRLPIVQNAGYAIWISTILAVIAAVMLFTRGLNYGVDFKGGTMIEVRVKNASTDVDLAKLRDVTNRLGLGGVQVQGFGLGNSKDALLRIETQPGGDKAQEGIPKKVSDALPDYEVRRIETVGAAVSSELKTAAIWAIIASLIGIFAYVWFRFEWQFAVASIVALIHDVFIAAGLFALLQLEFDLTIVAALLTLAGYSINDTVVIFDRIRENLRKFKKMPLTEVFNLSINETMSRTVLTAPAILMALIALYLFGGEVINGFALTMLFGIVIGTFSSIFVAAPLVLWFGVDREAITGGEAKPAEAATAKV
jgi:preprotein translocase subunit SecF